MQLKLIITAAALSLTKIITAQNPLAIPDTLSGTSFNLSIYDTSKVFYPGYVTDTYGVNAAYLGPTLFLNKGDSVSLVVNNTLTDTTTMHWHGMHVSAKNDGGPHALIFPGTSWNPKFRVRDLAGTYWYHPHLHMMTNLQATKGAAGLVIVRDSAEAALSLPRTYGIDDFPLVIQTKEFDSNKQIVVGYHADSVVMVNGTIKPYLLAPAQVIRLRLLNACSERVYNLGFTGNLNFYQVTSDGGLLPNPVTLTRLRLAPGERAEILVNLAGMQTQSIRLMSYASELPNGIYGAANPAAMGGATIPGYSVNPVNGANFSILQLQVVAQTSNAISTVPSSLTPVSAITASSSVITRTLTFSPKTMGPNQALNGPFVINGASFNMNVINYSIPENSIETWVLNNQTAIAHPFHIHDVQFYILSINGAVAPLNMQGRKDVVLVPAQQTVKFIAKFDDFCDTIPYMYHCHMLPHEDDGMMGQFNVLCTTAGVHGETADENKILLFPNPAAGKLEINLNSLQNTVYNTLTVYDETGRVIYTSGINGQKLNIDVSAWNPGFYTASLTGNEKSLNKKLVIH